MRRSNYTHVINELCSELCDVDAEDEGHVTTDRLGDRVQVLAKESPDDEVWRALSFACNYHLGGAGGLFSYGPYSPMFVFPEGGDQYRVFPTPLDRVDGEMLDVWATCASDEALHPIPRARLADLLWVRKHGDRGQWIKVAVTSYTEAAAITDVHVVERGEMLARAAAICQESRDQDARLKADALTALSGLAQESIATTGDRFGVVARALIALIDAGYPCEAILADAMRKYDSDPDRASDLRALAIKASPDRADRLRLQAERIEAFESAAGLATGLRRVSLLEDARSIASSIGDSKEVERLSGLIQRTDFQGDMERLEVSTTIDDEVIQSVVEQITGDDTLSEALDRFAQYLTPNLRAEAMEQKIGEIAQAAPLQALLGRICFGPDGTAISLPSGSPERHIADMGQQRTQEIAWSSGLFGQPVLAGLDKRYDMGPPNLVASFSPAMPQNAVDTIVAAHERWQARDHRSAVALLWPAIEQIMRSVCLARGLTTASRQSTSFPQTRSLGELLEDLAPHIDETYARYLDAALVDGWALNLRNLYAHGHTPGVDHGIAYGILFHIVCVLREIAMSTR